MNFKRSVLAAAFAVTVGVPSIGGAVTLSSSGPGLLSGSFTQAVTAGAPIVDYFDFTPMSIGGTVSVVLSSLSGPVSFFAASLNDQNFSFFPENGPLDRVSFSATFATAGPLTLTVFGAASDDAGNLVAGSYGGTVNVTTALAVPEPSTWVLMGLGLGTLGWAARRRTPVRVVVRR